MTVAAALLLYVTSTRFAELLLDRRNTRNLLSAGAVEHSPGHYPVIVILHAAWLAGLWIMGRDAPVNSMWFGLFACLQLARLWVLVTLGGRWTTRIIVLPSEPLIRAGPYRFLSHPNYLVVVGEIAVLPLALGLPLYAMAFSALNAMILFVRIRAETRALHDTHGNDRRSEDLVS